MNAQTKRTCKTCGLSLPMAAFPKVGTKRQYLGHHCKSCFQEAKRLKHKEWRDANRKHIREYSRTMMQQRREAMPPDQRAEYLAKMCEAARIRRDKLRMVVFAAYGGYKCTCCGETEPHFLSLDHVNNDGYKRRKEGEPYGGERFYRMLINQGFPKDFQVLCMNCNHGKSRNGGICPHQSKEPSTTRRKP